MYLLQFKVTGCGAFPLDMLRYDACYPATQDDVDNLAASSELALQGCTRTYTLHRRQLLKSETPTVKRWESFLWSCRVMNVRKV